MADGSTPQPQQDRFAEINAIVKHRYETGAYGNAHFVLADDLWRAFRESAPRPSYGAGCAPGLSHLLSIPVVLDGECPPNAWRLVDDRGEILFEGTADLGASDG